MTRETPCTTMLGVLQRTWIWWIGLPHISPLMELCQIALAANPARAIYLETCTEAGTPRVANPATI